VEVEKLCPVCGRRFAWRRKWAAVWDEVRYCSEACRGRRRAPVDAQLEDAVRTLLSARAAGATICPSEAARLVAPDAWRGLMEAARAAARRLAAAGEVDVTQGGRVVDAATARGPIRLRLRRRRGTPTGGARPSSR
jgi:hypothetical protein